MKGETFPQSFGFYKKKERCQANQVKLTSTSLWSCDSVKSTVTLCSKEYSMSILLRNGFLLWGLSVRAGSRPEMKIQKSTGEQAKQLLPFRCKYLISFHLQTRLSGEWVNIWQCFSLFPIAWYNKSHDNLFVSCSDFIFCW